jgi:hypothetical protein
MSLGFTIQKGRNYFSASKRYQHGRIHLLFATDEHNSLYCDLHHDSCLHLMFLGTDYEKIPQMLFDQEISKAFQKNGIEYHVAGGFNWFRRKNRAVLQGVRLS